MRARFRLGMGLMLLPLLNLAAATWYSSRQIDEAVRSLVTSPRTQWREQLTLIDAARAETMLALVVACTGGTLVAAVTGRLLARSVLRPLVAIRRAADSWGRGELTHRVRAVRGDELGEVAHAFDVMAGRLQRSQEILVHAAGHDALTDLPNRRLLLEWLTDRGTADPPQALFLIDLEGLRTVNDSLRHAAGDDVLVEAARRLRAAVDGAGSTARLAGEKFAVLMPCPAAPAEAVAVADRLRREIRRPFTAHGREVVLDASIGIVTDVAARHGAAEALLRDADLAMYVAKRAGGGRSELFVPALHERALARLEIEAELREALRLGQIRPHFQPVTDAHTGDLIGLEALARWEHPRRGLIPPSRFIPVAEESALIVPLGQQILERACVELAQWQRAHPQAPPLRLSVNVSGRQLAEADLPDQLGRALSLSGLAPGQLTLEITETVMMHDAETTLARLQALTAQGVSLAVDDFGTGYSSLSYLQRFPIRTLKVDRSFVAPLGTHGDAAVLTGAVLRLAETLGLRVIAEGVETPEQLSVLRRLGCPAVQGYLFGQPARLEDLTLVHRLASAGVHGLLTSLGKT